MVNPIVYAVPVFLALMALEWAVARRRGVVVYRAADTVASLSLGILSQGVAVFSKLATLGLYTAVYQHAALWRLPVDSPWVWVGALVAYDFCYYWLHRLGHTVQILWAAHAVHHSSEDYNLGTALRQTGSGFLLGWLFYLPMALAGVPPLVFAVVGLIDLLYQFWVHTRLVGRLGWFDRVFCSPSNHRVHHGQNDWCIDRNYGGILVLWDRLFGSFVDERDDDAIVYGVRGALASYSPVRANLQVYAGMLQDWRLARTWVDRLGVLWRRPGWRPPGAEAAAPRPKTDLAQFRPYDPPLPRPLAVHLLLQFALLIALALHFLAVAPQLSLGLAAAVALALLGQLEGLSRVGDRIGNTWRGEAVRWASGALLLVLSPVHGLPWLAAWGAAGLAGAWLLHRAGQPVAGPAITDPGPAAG
jgi:sterol desaturase/sphingolipid hydroxylase (fatty acid hydroxylase superfamily)